MGELFDPWFLKVWSCLCGNYWGVSAHSNSTVPHLWLGLNSKHLLEMLMLPEVGKHGVNTFAALRAWLVFSSCLKASLEHQTPLLSPHCPLHLLLSSDERGAENLKGLFTCQFEQWARWHKLFQWILCTLWCRAVPSCSDSWRSRSHPLWRGQAVQSGNKSRDKQLVTLSCSLINGRKNFFYFF